MRHGVLGYIRERLLPRRRSYYRDLFFRRVSAAALETFFKSLGICRGDTVLVHSALSRLGHIQGGPRTIIGALLRITGPEGTLVMPAFPFGGSMQEYVSSSPVFDLRTTPSLSGALSEEFRRLPGVRRSLHPTHSVCAFGRHAEALVRDHELSGSPCGPLSPFGKIKDVRAKVLRIGTGAVTLYHHLQEIVGYPNLHLPTEVSLRCVDAAGVEHSVSTRVYRAQIPNLLYLTGLGGERLAVHPSNFPFLFPGDREQHLRDANDDELLKLLLARRNEAAKRGSYRSGLINSCACDAFEVSAYIDTALPQLEAELERYRECYNLSELELLLANGKYPIK